MRAIRGMRFLINRRFEAICRNASAVCNCEISRRAVVSALSGALVGCRSRPKTGGPSVQFTRVPQADPAGQEKNDIIQGVVKGGRPGQQIVLYARSGKWWLQPLRTEPFTKDLAKRHVDKRNAPGHGLCGLAGGTRLPSAVYL